jgi:hypothetical protein
VTFRVDQDIVDELHRRHSSDVRVWKYYATTLRYAAEVLFRQVFADTAHRLRHRRRATLRPSVHAPALMIAGMMIEVLAKAVLLSARKPIKTAAASRHNLAAIVRATGCGLSVADRALLTRLSGFVRWAGRYPAPWKAGEMAVDDEHGNRNLLGGFCGADVTGVRRLADRLEAMLPGTAPSKGLRLPSGSATPDPWRTRRRRLSDRGHR